VETKRLGPGQREHDKSANTSTDPNKTVVEAGYWWFTLVFLTTIWEASLGKYFLRPPSPKYSKQNGLEVLPALQV
jgi:hypothetical protein